MLDSSDLFSTCLPISLIALMWSFIIFVSTFTLLISSFISSVLSVALLLDLCPCVVVLGSPAASIVGSVVANSPALCTGFNRSTMLWLCRVAMHALVLPGVSASSKAVPELVDRGHAVPSGEDLRPGCGRI